MNTRKFKMPLSPRVRSFHQKVLHFYFSPLCSGALSLSITHFAFVYTVNVLISSCRVFFSSLLFEFQFVTLFFSFFCRWCCCCCLRCPVICVYILLHNYPILNNEIQLQIECGKRANCILSTHTQWHTLACVQIHFHFVDVALSLSLAPHGKNPSIYISKASELKRTLNHFPEWNFTSKWNSLITVSITTNQVNNAK